RTRATLGIEPRTSSTQGKNPCITVNESNSQTCGPGAWGLGSSDKTCVFIGSCSTRRLIWQPRVRVPPWVVIQIHPDSPRFIQHGYANRRRHLRLFGFSSPSIETKQYYLYVLLLLPLTKARL